MYHYFINVCVAEGTTVVEVNSQAEYLALVEKIGILTDGNFILEDGGLTIMEVF